MQTQRALWSYGVFRKTGLLGSRLSKPCIYPAEFDDSLAKKEKASICLPSMSFRTCPSYNIQCFTSWSEYINQFLMKFDSQYFFVTCLLIWFVVCWLCFESKHKIQMVATARTTKFKFYSENIMIPPARSDLGQFSRLTERLPLPLSRGSGNNNNTEGLNSQVVLLYGISTYLERLGLTLLFSFLTLTLLLAWMS